MLGRNAARPLGLTPARLMTAYNMAAHHRIAYWITKPFTMAHMQRFITISPQLLLTIGGSSTLTLTKNPGPPSPSSTTYGAPTTSSTSSASHQVHTLAPLQADVLLHSLLPSPPPSPSPVHVPTSTTSDTQSSTPTTTSPSSVAYNYMLAASWSPKSRRRVTPTQFERDGEDEWWRKPTHTTTTAPGTPGLPSSTTKRRTGKVDAGEDAFFHVSTPSRVALGVADGVGGWSEVSDNTLCLLLLCTPPTCSPSIPNNSTLTHNIQQRLRFTMRGTNNSPITVCTKIERSTRKGLGSTTHISFIDGLVAWGMSPWIMFSFHEACLNMAQPRERVRESRRRVE